MTHQEIQTATPCRALWAIVTPETAARWLESNRNNRNVRKSVVAKYAKDMRAGLWAPSNDAICVGTDGRLLNGQHRLSAVVASGASVGMFVITGMPEESFAHMDRGAGRTFADALRSRGAGKTSIVLAATLSRAVSYDRGVGGPRAGKKGTWTSHDFGVTDSDKTAYLAMQPDIERSAEMFGTQAASRATGRCPASILALAHHLIASATGSDAADLFMRQLITQDREPADGTIRGALRALGNCGSKHGYDDRKLAIILSAWNHWSAGREVSTIRIQEDYRTRQVEIAKRVTRHG